MAGNKKVTWSLWAMFVLACISMHRLALRNGTLDHTHAFHLEGAYLPHTTVPFHVGKTGIGALDEAVRLMLAIFWVDLDPRNVVAHTQGSQFLGTLSVAWMLMMVEAHRIDVSGSFLISTYLMETAGELIGLGCLTPLWCILHTRSAASNKPRTIPARDGILLPVALVLGHFLPTAMMLRCKLDGEGLLSEQHWILIRLFHPLLSYAVWRCLRALPGLPLTSTHAQAWYTTAIIYAVASNTLSLAPWLMSHMASGYITPSIAEQFDLWAILVPAPFWHLRPAKVSSFEEGVSVFLRWDQIWTESAICLWAMSQYLGSGEAKWTAKLSIQTCAHFGLILLLGGPAALAAYLMQQCDRNAMDRPGMAKSKRV